MQEFDTYLITFDHEKRRPVLFKNNTEQFADIEMVDGRYLQVLVDIFNFIGIPQLLEVLCFCDKYRIVQQQEFQDVVDNLVRNIINSQYYLSIPELGYILKIYKGKDLDNLVLGQIQENLKYNDLLLRYLLQYGQYSQELIFSQIFIKSFQAVISNVDVSEIISQVSSDQLLFIRQLQHLILTDQFHQQPLQEQIYLDMLLILVLFKPSFQFSFLVEKFPTKIKLRQAMIFSNSFNNLLQNKDPQIIQTKDSSGLMSIIIQSLNFCTNIATNERQTTTLSQCSTIFCQISGYIIHQILVNKPLNDEFERVHELFFLDYLSQIPNSLLAKHYLMLNLIYNFDEGFINRIFLDTVFDLFCRISDLIINSQEVIRMSQFTSKSQGNDQYIDELIISLSAFINRMIERLLQNPLLLQKNTEKLNQVVKRLNLLRKWCSIQDYLFDDLILVGFQFGQLDSKVINQKLEVIIDYYKDQAQYSLDYKICLKYDNIQQIMDSFLLCYGVQLNHEFVEENIKLFKLQFDQYTANNSFQSEILLKYSNLVSILSQYVNYLSKDQQIVELIYLLNDVLINSQLINKKPRGQISQTIFIITIFILSSLDIKQVNLQNIDYPFICNDIIGCCRYIGQLVWFDSQTVSIFFSHMLNYQSSREDNNSQVIQQLQIHEFYCTPQLEANLQNYQQSLNYHQIIQFIFLHETRQKQLLPYFLQSVKNIIPTLQFNLIKFGYLYIIVCILMCQNFDECEQKLLVKLEKTLTSRSQFLNEYFTLFVKHFLLSVFHDVCYDLVLNQSNDSKMNDNSKNKYFQTVFELVTHQKCYQNFNLIDYLLLLLQASKQDKTTQNQFLYQLNSQNEIDYLEESSMYNLRKMFCAVTNQNIAASSYTASQLDEQLVKLTINAQNDISRKLNILSPKSINYHLLTDANNHIDIFQTPIILRNHFDLNIINKNQIFSFLVRLYVSRVNLVYLNQTQNFLLKTATKDFDQYVTSLITGIADGNYILSQLLLFQHENVPYFIQNIQITLQFLLVTSQLFISYLNLLYQQYPSSSADFCIDKIQLQIIPIRLFEQLLELLNVFKQSSIEVSIFLVMEILLSRVNLLFYINNMLREKGNVESTTYLKPFLAFLSKKNLQQYVGFMGHLSCYHNSVVSGQLTLYTNEIVTTTINLGLEITPAQITVLTIPNFASHLPATQDLILVHRNNCWFSYRQYYLSSVSFVYELLDQICQEMFGTSFGTNNVIIVIALFRDKTVFKRLSDCKITFDFDDDNLQLLTFRNIVLVLLKLLNVLTKIPIVGKVDALIHEIDYISMQRYITSLFDILLGAYGMTAQSFSKDFKISCLIDNVALQSLQLNQNDLEDYFHYLESYPLFQYLCIIIRTMMQRSEKHEITGYFLL